MGHQPFQAGEAGAIRFKSILLTALAAMIGAAVILADPIFQGLAISLLFGLASSTLLTVLVIPAIYVVLRGKSDGAPTEDTPRGFGAVADRSHAGLLDDQAAPIAASMAWQGTKTAALAAPGPGATRRMGRPECFASRWKVQRKLWTPEKTRGSPLQARRSEPSGSHLRLARRS